MHFSKPPIWVIVCVCFFIKSIPSFRTICNRRQEQRNQTIYFVIIGRKTKSRQLDFLPECVCSWEFDMTCICKKNIIKKHECINFESCFKTDVHSKSIYIFQIDSLIKFTWSICRVTQKQCWEVMWNLHPMSHFITWQSHTLKMNKLNHQNQSLHHVHTCL